MSTMYIAEYSGVGLNFPADGGVGVQAAKAPPVAHQTITFTGTSGESLAFNDRTRLVRIHVDGIASIRFTNPKTGSSTTAQQATTSYARMAADATEYFAVDPGMFVSAITNT